MVVCCITVQMITSTNDSVLEFYLCYTCQVKV